MSEQERKTIGDCINEVAEEYASTEGIYILERALLQILELPTTTLITYDGVLSHNTKAYQKINAHEAEVLDEIRATIRRLKALEADVDEVLERLGG